MTQFIDTDDLNEKSMAMAGEIHRLAVKLLFSQNFFTFQTPKQDIETMLKKHLGFSSQQLHSFLVDDQKYRDQPFDVKMKSLEEGVRNAEASPGLHERVAIFPAFLEQKNRALLAIEEDLNAQMEDINTPVKRSKLRVFFRSWTNDMMEDIDRYLKTEKAKLRADEKKNNVVVEMTEQDAKDFISLLCDFVRVEAMTFLDTIKTNHTDHDTLFIHPTELQDTILTAREQKAADLLRRKNDGFKDMCLKKYGQN